MEDTPLLLFENVHVKKNMVFCSTFMALIDSCGSQASKKTNRFIVVGVVDSASNKNNKRRTSKYTLWTFLPRNLAEQFRRMVNFYFLIVACISLVIDSPVSPLTTIAPLSFVVFVTSCKQGYEDWRRHRADNLVNNMKVQIIQNGELVQVKNKTIKPGTLVYVPRDREVPADLVLLCAEDVYGKCYVTTANLDGEANLKILRVPPILIGHTMYNLPEVIELEVAPPIADLYTFFGRMSIPGRGTVVLTPENFMLRGSRVKSSEWALGCAVYTGEETKIALNSIFKINKFSTSERAINSFMIIFVAVLFIFAIASAVAKWAIEKSRPERLLYVGPANHSVTTFLNDFVSFLLLYHYIVPLSLYVTIETYKFIGAMFIGWDEDLKYHGREAKANTSDLNEELGQVQMLFSDKTGTLTKNQMVFKACSICGQIYEARDGNLYNIYEPNYPAKTEQKDISLFFTILSLCHDIQLSVKEFERVSTKVEKEQLGGRSSSTTSIGINDLINYQSNSPDEKALVEFAARIGFAFLCQEGYTMRLRIKDNLEQYEKLQVIEFTSERKRMSVIVRDASGQIWLFCKGAESAVLPLCKNIEGVVEVTRNITGFSTLGLRTLAVAFRRIDEEEYQDIVKRTNQIDLEKMEDTSRLFSELEKGLIVVGATAIEDSLQDGAAETLATLKQAGIRTWILTGDKMETAMNISQSCAHILDEDKKLFLVDVKSKRQLIEKLSEYETLLAETKDINESTGTALIVDGTTFAEVLASKCAPRFIELCLQCTAVLCVRLSPLQKAEIVGLVKRSPGRPVTAAIGDGANDVSMIQEAHVGFGIYGREGEQAASCADFAFSDFAMLPKILLVQGHWYYHRLATLVHYIFYKCIVLALMMLFYQFHSTFSTQAVYDSLYITLYGMIYTSFPPILLSLTDKVWSAETLMSHPALYKTIARNQLLRWKILGAWIFYAVLHTSIMYLVTYLAFRHDVINEDAKTLDLWSFGAALFHLTVLIVNLVIWHSAFYQTYIFIITVLFSIVSNVIICTIYSFNSWQFDGTYHRLLKSIPFWALNLIVIVLCMCLDVLSRLYMDLEWQTYLRLKKEEAIMTNRELMNKIPTFPKLSISLQSEDKSNIRFRFRLSSS